jgi:hypothetical protein
MHIIEDWSDGVRSVYDLDALKIPGTKILAASLSSDNLYSQLKPLGLNIKAGMGRHELMMVLAKHLKPKSNVVVVHSDD